jgi:hypothetical protein
MQSQLPERVWGRVYTLIDLVWSLMRLVSLGVGGVLADSLGVRTVYYIGGTLLAGSGVLGLVLLRGHNLKEPSSEGVL